MSDENVTRADEDPALWFRTHYERAAGEILEFLASAGIEVEDRDIADVGCGDGIIDLGLAVQGKPASLVGYDLRPADTDALQRAAAAAGVAEVLPESLAFVQSEPERIPALSDSFDVVVTWSVFEHVSRPAQMLSEIERILKPDGVLFLQLWPFFGSEHGGHLWPHYEETFPHLLHSDEEIRRHVRGRRGTDHTRDADDEYDSLNRITLDDLQRALLSAGLVVRKLELLTGTFHIPGELAHLPLSTLGIAGVKLLATSARGRPPAAAPEQPAAQEAESD